MTDTERPDTLDRRRFLTVLGTTTAGGALALSGCSTDRVQKLVPYLVQSEDQVPGVATWYASSCTECQQGCGVHVRTREGRAVKLEGNPDHPINQGKLCSRGQAALQGLYNPGRIQAPMARGANGQLAPITWDDAIGRLAVRLNISRLVVVGETARPMASVPTGIPAGICTMERRESRPLKARLSIGTPNTGRVVSAAVMPGRCAAPPAPATITLKPASHAPLAKANRRSGVRWAETMRA